MSLQPRISLAGLHNRLLVRPSSCSHHMALNYASSIRHQFRPSTKFEVNAKIYLSTSSIFCITNHPGLRNVYTVGFSIPAQNIFQVSAAKEIERPHQEFMRESAQQVDAAPWTRPKINYQLVQTLAAPNRQKGKFFKSLPSLSFCHSFASAEAAR